MRNQRIGLVAVLVLLLAACGPSSEAVATMTAAAWTPTPLPTPTPTPVPFDVTVSVVDAASNPIGDAFLAVPQLGMQEAVISDATGHYSLFNLPTGEFTIIAGAQGYFDKQQDVPVQRGSNEVVITLERDPLQLLASEACQPGQQALYLEDFEDGQAQDWPISRPAWKFEQMEGHGTVLTRMPGDGVFTRSNVENTGNTVWHLDFYNNTLLLWFYQRYAGEGSPGSLANLIALIPPQVMISGGSGAGAGTHGIASGRAAPVGESGWRHMSVAYFNGDIDVWIDGNLVVGVTDPSPLEAGDLALESSASDATTSYDNMVICTLDEPYTP